MTRALALALSLLAAGPATALTCAPPDPVRSFAAAQAAPERYVLLYGRLAFDPSRMPQSGFQGEGGDGVRGAPDMLMDPVPARLSGFALGLDGWTRPVEAAVTLRPSCAGPWCGTMGPGTWLLFAREAPGGYEVEVGPCGGWAFEDPAEAVLRQMAACLRGEACGP